MQLKKLQKQLTKGVGHCQWRCTTAGGTGIKGATSTQQWEIEKGLILCKFYVYYNVINNTLLIHLKHSNTQQNLTPLGKYLLIADIRIITKF